MDAKPQPYREPQYHLPPWFYLNMEAVRTLETHLQQFARSFRLSHSQIEQLCKMAKDLADWREGSALKEFLRQQVESLRGEQAQAKPPATNIPKQPTEHIASSGAASVPQKLAPPINSQRNLQMDPKRRKTAMAELTAFYQGKRQHLPNFQRSAPKPKVPRYRFEVLHESPNLAAPNAQSNILGRCPVASVKTRCCNLLTLDAIQQCGFGCSYCAIQHFYDDQAIQVRDNFAQKLEQLQLDPQKWYHIGTGQASDSLLWSEELGVLDPLLAFARRYPRVILELKSKSANVQGLLHRELPPNMLFTWSLNPDNFIRHEEPLTAALAARLRAARQLADYGAKVGFHFHPIVRYQAWKSEYRELAEQLVGLFTPQEVVTVSLGTLTFSKSALKTIRHKAQQSQILRFPMEEIAGKFSYPYAVKREMFAHVYTALQPWHGQVFFYLCMEDPALWNEIFGHQYYSNQEFEQDMLCHYARKMQL